jgi:hypothetical protein
MTFMDMHAKTQQLVAAVQNFVLRVNNPERRR